LENPSQTPPERHACVLLHSKRSDKLQRETKHNTHKSGLGLRFGHAGFKNMRFKKVTFENTIKHSVKLHFNKITCNILKFYIFKKVPNCLQFEKIIYCKSQFFKNTFFK
jgi:hypothetical protein